jgi:hypothetical protein
MIVVRIACLSAVAVLLTGGTASAFWFQTPSKKIACAGDSKQIRCDTEFATRFAAAKYKPKGCSFDWGQAFEMTPRGAARIGCVSDTVLNHKAKVLPYGQSKTFGAFRCKSSTSGLRCTNRSGHGWLLSRQTQSLF